MCHPSCKQGTRGAGRPDDVSLLFAGGRSPQPQAGSGSFAALVTSLSEPGGAFDTDNLVSNERSYLEPLATLDRQDLRGGAYIGVGPDQNFTYIARLHPSVAFIVDIRRDNLLLHLLFKALFARGATRTEYLSRLFGRPPPADAAGHREDTAAALIDGQETDAARTASLRRETDADIARLGLGLSAVDMATIDRFHRTFIDEGLGLRFRSAGRPPQPHYPTYRDLLLAETRDGVKGSFLASEEAFQVVKDLEARDLVVPVVGDQAGPKALRAIAGALERRGARVSAFYTSNVEFYLARDGTLEAFTRNLARLPRMPGAVIVRSVFGRFEGGSRSGVEPIEEVLAAQAR